jgi:hypothetical protein
VAVGGLLAGTLAWGLTEAWLNEHTRTNLSMAVAVGIWFTAGLGWLTPRKWPRLLVVFSLAGAAGWLLSEAVQRLVQ